MIFLIYVNERGRFQKAIFDDNQWEGVIEVTNNARFIVDCFKSKILTERDFLNYYFSLF